MNIDVNKNLSQVQAGCSPGFLANTADYMFLLDLQPNSEIEGMKLG